MSLVVTVPSTSLAESLAPLPEGVELLVWDMHSPAPRERLDIVVPPYMDTTAVLPSLSGVDVGLVQGQSIGYDDVIGALPPDIRFANAAGVHETSTAELALALMLAAQRQLPRFLSAQERGEWAPVVAESLADRRVLLLGFGGVGQAIAARLQAFEVELTVVARTARAESHPVLGEVQVHGLDELPALLPDAEIVVLTLPGGEGTRHVIDEHALQNLRDGALVVNVGRGTLIDTDALVRHAGRIRAALDVVDPEPLPADHPLWHAPGILLVPHVGGASTAMDPRMTRLVRTQIERMLRGEPPVNIVLGGS